MVALRLHRFGQSVLAQSDPQVGLHRLAMEVATETAGSGEIKLHRFAASVLVKIPPKIGLNRMAVEVATETAGSGEIKLHRFAMSFLVESSPKVGVGRLAMEVATETAGSGAIRLHRYAYSVLALVALPIVEPLPLVEVDGFFFHNWASQVSMETSFQTDITTAPSSLAQERRTLAQRPDRVITFRWTQKGRVEMDRIRKLLRSYTDAPFQLPLYQDVAAVTVASAIDQPILKCDVAFKRFFVGARVVVCPHPRAGRVDADDMFFAIINEVSSDQLRLDINLPINVSTDYVVFPLIDCEILLEPEMPLQTTDVADMTLTVSEFKGKNSLPPIAVGLPIGWTSKLGLPVFEIMPDWSSGVSTIYRRVGAMQVRGRKKRPILQGPRYIQVQNWPLVLDNRYDFFRVLGMFESRRGMCLPLWAIDHEFQWQVVDTDPNFIDVLPLGAFDEFEKWWTESGIAAAIVMKDGTIHLAQVNTVEDNSSTWRLELIQSIPDPISLANIDHFARVRVSHFDSDAFTEEWQTTTVAKVDLTTVELLSDKEVDPEA